MKRKYTFELEIREGNDEFWEDLNKKEDTMAINEMYFELKSLLENSAFSFSDISLKEFTYYEEN